MDRRLPNCCGSEDGDLVYGVDSTRDTDTMVEAWVCNSCRAISIANMVQIQHN